MNLRVPPKRRSVELTVQPARVETRKRPAASQRQLALCLIAQRGGEVKLGRVLRSKRMIGDKRRLCLSQSCSFVRITDDAMVSNLQQLPRCRNLN